MAFEIPKLQTDDLTTPGPWWRPIVSDGVRTARMKCGSCHATASLADHRIESDGTVKPSVVCPTENCTFHEMAVLKGWTES